MNHRDTEAIEHAKALKDYCDEHAYCEDCWFLANDNLCALTTRPASDWKLPRVKTYREDFLEKFPEVSFDADRLCRKYLYPNSEKHCNCDSDECEQCWNERYIEGGK